MWLADFVNPKDKSVISQKCLGSTTKRVGNIFFRFEEETSMSGKGSCDNTKAKLRRT